jgi:hypothetical protein
MNQEIISQEQEFNILLLVPNFRNKLLGVDYLINRFKLKDDMYLKPVYEEIAKNIKTPLEDWEEQFVLNKD